MTPGTETRYASGAPFPEPRLEEANTILLGWEETLVHGRPPRWVRIQGILAGAGVEVGLTAIAEADCRVCREAGSWEAFLMELPATPAVDRDLRKRLVRRLTAALRQRSGGEHLFRDVPSALARWAGEGRQLAVIGESSQLEAACTRLGLAAHLRAWQAAPAPSLAQGDLFRGLLEELDADPGGTALISCRPELELMGGQAAGIGQLLILDRYGLYLREGHPRYAVLPHL